MLKYECPRCGARLKDQPDVQGYCNASHIEVACDGRIEPAWFTNLPRFMQSLRLRVLYWRIRGVKR